MRTFQIDSEQLSNMQHGLTHPNDFLISHPAVLLEFCRTVAAEPGAGAASPLPCLQVPRCHPPPSSCSGGGSIAGSRFAQLRARGPRGAGVGSVPVDRVILSPRDEKAVACGLTSLGCFDEN